MGRGSRRTSRRACKPYDGGRHRITYGNGIPPAEQVRSGASDPLGVEKSHQTVVFRAEGVRRRCLGEPLEPGRRPTAHGLLHGGEFGVEWPVGFRVFRNDKIDDARVRIAGPLQHLNLPSHVCRQPDGGSFHDNVVERRTGILSCRCHAVGDCEECSHRGGSSTLPGGNRRGPAAGRVAGMISCSCPLHVRRKSAPRCADQ